MAKAQAAAQQNEELTIQDDEIPLDEAEDFKTPSAGVHNAYLSNVELDKTKEKPDKPQRDMIIVTATLSPEDPDAPNLPLRKYVTFPVPGDRDLMWGTRTAWGAQIKTIQETLTAFGGQESGGITKMGVLNFLDAHRGDAVKVKIKNELRTDPVTKEPLDPPEIQASIEKLLPY